MAPEARLCQISNGAPKERIFPHFRHPDLFRKSGARTGWGGAQSLTVSLHRPAPRSAGEEESEDDDGHGSGERRRGHGRGPARYRTSDGEARGGSPTIRPGKRRGDGRGSGAAPVPEGVASGAGRLALTDTEFLRRWRIRSGPCVGWGRTETTCVDRRLAVLADRNFWPCRGRRRCGCKRWCDRTSLARVQTKRPSQHGHPPEEAQSTCRRLVAVAHATARRRCMTARSTVRQNRLAAATASHAVAHQTDTPVHRNKPDCDAFDPVLQH
jgi:hypothetical protein